MLTAYSRHKKEITSELNASEALLVLDRRVVQALPLGYDRLVEVEGGRGSRDRNAPEVSPEPREVPDPREVRYAL